MAHGRVFSLFSLSPIGSFILNYAEIDLVWFKTRKFICWPNVNIFQQGQLILIKDRPKMLA